MIPPKNIIVDIAFNSRSSDIGWPQGLTEPWITYRMSIFMEYTLNSLKKQTNQNFTALIRYADATENIIVLTLKKYDPLPGNIRFIPDSSNIEIQCMLSEGYDELYLVRLDCDDTYHMTYIQQLQDYTPKPDTCVLINQTGYVYDSLDHRIAAIRRASPPFYTWIYKTEDYFYRNKRYIRGHRRVKKYNHEILTTDENRNFLIVLHERNTSNQKMLSKYEFKSEPSQVNAILNNFI
jgi:hypothetical protein